MNVRSPIFSLCCLVLATAPLWMPPLGAQAPLLEDVIATGSLRTEAALEWRAASAERALQSGLPGLAESGFRELLESASAGDRAQRAEWRLGLSKALLAQGQHAQARAELAAVGAEDRSPRHALTEALAIFAEGGEAVDREAFEAALARARAAELPDADRPWLRLAEAFAAELAGDAEAAREAYTAAAEASPSPFQRAHFEGLALRQRLLEAPADVGMAAELRAKINALDGDAAYPFVRQYAVLLHSLGRVGEAVGAIERELETVSVGYGTREREQLRLLKGIILGAESESGRAALKELIRSGSDREAMGIALQLLSRAPDRDADLIEFLNVIISRTERHPLLGQMYYLRSQLALRDPEMRTVAESDARILLEQFPGLSEITNVYRLLAYAALEKSPPQYRTAADFLIQLRDQTADAAEQVELNRLIGDCYFLNGDYGNAVDFYSAARSREIGLARDGDLFLRLVLSLIRSEALEAALRLIDEADFSGAIPVQDRWRAEWNVSQALRAAGAIDAALERVRLLLADVAPSTVPAALDFRLNWLEARLSLDAGELDGLGERIAPILARLEALPVEAGSDLPDALSADLKELLRTEFLLLQSEVAIRSEDPATGRQILEELRAAFPQSAAAQRSYLIEADYEGRIGDFGAAQGTLKELADGYPQSPLAAQALFEAALYCERRGPDFFPQAVVLLNELAERYPEDSLIYAAGMRQGNLLRLMNDFPGAQIVYENLINAFPRHDMRYLAELSRADCMFALAGDDEAALRDVVAALEQLLDLPNLPTDFQVEASYKWAFALLRSGAREEASDVLRLSIGRFLLDDVRASELGRPGRYWVARSMLELGDLLEADAAIAEARRIYRKMIAYNLPGRQIAEARVDRLLDLR